MRELTFIFFLFLTPFLTAQSFLSVDYIGSKSSGQLATQFFTTFEFGADFYRVTYASTDTDGNSVTVSGLLALPNDLDHVFPMLVYQHGTAGNNNDVPSNLGLDADLPIAMAGKGYIVLAPDQLGLGVHPGVHPYLHAASEAWVAVDMMRALRDYAPDNGLHLNDQVFVTGYSQGGHSAMALHQMLETELSDEFTVTASAPMSGPYSMSEVTKNVLLSGEPYPRPGYMINVFVSYQHVYGNIYTSIEEAFKPPYQDLVAEYANDEISLTAMDIQLGNLLTANAGANILIEALNDDYLQMITDNPAHPVNLALEENDVFDWSPVAPTRLYYCQADEQVTYQNSLIAETTMQDNGASDVQAVNVNSSASHSVCAFLASLTMADFFAQYQVIEPLTASVETLHQPLSVFPNPAAEMLTIEALPEAGLLELYNSSGQLVKSSELHPGSTSFDIRNIPQGMYLLRVQSGNQLLTDRLVIQRNAH